MEEFGGFEFESFFGHLFEPEEEQNVARALSTENEEQEKNPGERTFKEVDVDTFLEGSLNENTKKKTDGDLRFFKNYLLSRNELREPEIISAEELNNYICGFLLGATKCNGHEYEPSTLRGFISSIDRYLKAKNSNISIMKDIQFYKARMVLKGKQKQLKSAGYGNKPKTAEPLQEIHIKKMHEANTLGDENPTALLHSLWLICTTHFGMQTGREVHSLCWGDVSLGIDHESGEEYIILDTERQTKTRTGENPKDTRLLKPKAYSNPDNPTQDPVHLYKLYRSKRPVTACEDNSPFFLVPGGRNQKCWYRNTAMGINRLYAIMKDMKEDAGIQAPRITPYSARKRMIQKLTDDGVPANQIVQISGHKNVNSLNNYSKMNNEQNRSISGILSNKPCSTVAVAPNQNNKENLVAPTTDSDNFMPRGFFINSNFHGNVTFNFNTNRSDTTHTQLSQQVVQPGQSTSVESFSPDSRRPFKRIRPMLYSDTDSD